MKITTVGLDLAKDVFQVHGVDESGKTVLQRRLKRGEMAAFFARLPACRVGMEACAGAHHWARKLTGYGHTVRLMAAQFVKPYVKSNKNDARDAEAICEAVSRPNMRFVAVKTPEQQAVLALHRLRAGWIKMRTAQVNALRGLLHEFGIVLPVGVGRFRSQAPAVLEDAENGLPGLMRHSLAQGLELLAELDRRITEVESQLHTWHRENSHCQRVSQVPGIGVLTATAMVASAGSPESFENARQAVAWVGLAPRQVSSGGKATLLGISKRGDAYLRMLLIHGARSVIAQAKRRPPQDDWLHRLLARAHPNVAVCALAAKNMRTAWALWRHERDYQPGYHTT